jgi:predicted TIM-barrel fold metal-dependent hydrolase
VTAVELNTRTEDASAQALALLCELQSRIDALAAVAADYPNRFAPEPSWRLGNAIRHVNRAIAALGGEA